jgi:O-antigen ligase
MMAWALVAAYACLGAWVPGALAAALLLGTAGDWMLPWHGLNVFSNEWALAGSVLGLALRRLSGKRLPPMPWWIVGAAAPLLLIVFLHVAGPGAVGPALKDTLRAAQFVLGVLLPAWLIHGPAFERSRSLACAFILAAVGLGLAQGWQGPGGALNAGHASEVFYGVHQAVASFFQHHNQFGAFLAAALPFSLAAGAPLLALLGAGALYACYSRGAALGLFLGGLGFSWALPRRLLWQGGLVLALGLGLGVAVSAPLRVRVSSIFDRSQNQDRALLRGVGREILQDHGYWGRGPGTVAVELPQRLQSLTLRPQDRVMFSAHLHDQWLEWQVELGAAGVLGWAFFFGCLVLAAVSRLLRGGPGRGYALALGVAVLAYAAQSFTDRLDLHARGLEIALLWGFCLAGMTAEESDV